MACSCTVSHAAPKTLRAPDRPLVPRFAHISCLLALAPRLVITPRLLSHASRVLPTGAVPRSLHRPCTASRHTSPAPHSTGASFFQEHAHQQLQRTHTSMTKPGGATLHTHQHAHIAHTPARIFPFALQLHTAFERRSLSRVERACESCVMQGKAFRHAPIEACKSYTPVRAWGLTRSISIRRIGVCSVVAGGAVCFQSVEIQIAF